ncbi:MAG: zinc-ribbon domain-containing protein [Ilumatobacteraceae bacterium]
MRCPSCGTDVRVGQKFCMECGTALHAAEATRPIPVGAPVQSGEDDPTRPLVQSRRQSFGPPVGEREQVRPTLTERRDPAHDATIEMTAGRQDVDATTTMRTVDQGASTAQLAHTTELPVTVPGRRGFDEDRPARFRLRILLVLAALAAAATAVGALSTLLEITADGADFDVGPWKANDLGTNNAVAGLIAAGTMVAGASAWCFGYRWGAGLAGGAGAALAGWAALVIGLAELPVAAAERSTIMATIERPYGYWVLAGAGALGVVTLLASLAGSGRGRRSGLDPWIAALGATSVLLAAGGPLVPEGTADWSGNYSSDTLGVDLPLVFFVGRAVQLGLLALCGVVGFLLVRRWGLGLAIGSAVAAGWMLVTAATDQTVSPIGPGYANPANPEAFDLQPHAATIVGFALVGFFGLVATVMALLDADR